MRIEGEIQVNCEEINSDISYITNTKMQTMQDGSVCFSCCTCLPVVAM